MLPTKTIFARTVRKFRNSIMFAAAIGLLGFPTSVTPSLALSPTPSAVLAYQAKAANHDVVQARAVVRRGGVAVGPRGGAIAAGAAIGVVTAATAVAWAGAAHAPGMCWYYTDPSRTQGFWDYCP